MLQTTSDIIRSALKADPSIPVADRTQILATVRNHGQQPEPEPEKPTPTESRIARRREVAERFGRSLRFVDKLASEGILPKVTLPGRKRAAGFPSEAVEKLLAAEGLQ